MSPVIFEKKINFSEYQAFVYPLSYLLDKTIIGEIQGCRNFKERTLILNRYFISLIKNSTLETKPVIIFSEMLDNCAKNNQFNVSVKTLAEKYGISARTQQRYFEATNSQGTKRTLQILRIRKAVAHLAKEPGNFLYKIYGYHAYSHFYKQACSIYVHILAY